MIIKSKMTNLLRAAVLVAPAFLLVACLGVDGDDGINFGTVAVAVKNFPEASCTVLVEITPGAPSAGEGEEVEPTEPEPEEVSCDEVQRLTEEVASEDGSLKEIGEREYGESPKLNAFLGQHAEPLTFTAEDFDEESRITHTFPQTVQNNKNYTVKLDGPESCTFEENGQISISSKKADKTFVVDCSDTEEAEAGE